ncbi:PQQ-dependent sugar dehydrogenase [Salinimicrobium sp. GXAS 041]|uniref:PQQ-dependent sugar dehydrogenase n=1 Tax=Salinimicrobium sp. GXAS 041 TaxID=3400806 RepID=UPI003C793E90
MKRIILSLSVAFSFVACGENGKSNEGDTGQAITKDTTATANIIASESLPADSSQTEYGYEVVVPDLQIAWGMDFLPDGSMLITEKGGDLIHFSNGEKRIVQGAPEVYNRGQGGFLDVAVHPDYESNGWIYFTYSSSEGEGEGGNTALMRAKLENGQLVQKEDLYKAVPNSTRGQHFGSRITFNEGYLYFSVGDRGNRDENPQDFTRDGGKIYRLNPDGSIPQDNPFVGEENAKEAIYSYGHRNPQGMILNSDTGEIWVHEHGPQGGDEINVIKKGENYGWPVVSYGINYDNSTFTDETSRPEFEDPIFYWKPSIAPSGMVYVTSNKYPELQGDLLVGSLKFMYIEHLKLEGKTVVGREKILPGVGRLRDLAQGPDGNIYASIEGTGIIKITTPASEEE